MYQQRFTEAQGGPLATHVGLLTGLTASTFMYVRSQRNGFTGFFPIRKLNAGHYTLILGAGFITYNFCSKFVSAVTGDVRQ